ncbi:MAG: pyridoxal 5'-phosphate synthase glutaminase subunit PdxT [Candidatus Nanopelagicales bacterium]
MTRPTVGVLALQGDFREHQRVLTSLGARAVGVRRSSELDAVDALVIPGGESTTIGKLAVAFDLLQPIRKRLAAGMPAYGSCAGLIMLADRLVDAPPDQVTFGGLDVAVRRNAFGRQVDSFEEDLEFAGVDGTPVHAVFIRAPWVEAVGPFVQVLARVPSTHAAGDAAGKVVAVRQGSLLATSFHPELMTGDTRVHRLFVEIVRGQA